jgi:DnaJ-class molecular chaperone
MKKRRYSIEEIKKWRMDQFERGEPSGLKDFYLAHGLCPTCRGRGKFLNQNSCSVCGGTGKAIKP